MLMAIDAAELDWLSVDAEHASLRTSGIVVLEQINSAESDFLPHGTTVDGNCQVVQIWVFSGPLAWILHGEFEPNTALSSLGFACYFGSIDVQQPQFDIGITIDLDVNLESGISVLVIEERLNSEVFNVLLGEFVNPDITKDTAKPPLILYTRLVAQQPGERVNLEAEPGNHTHLILNVGSIASLVHLNVENVPGPK